MKKLSITAFALICFIAAGFAQTDHTVKTKKASPTQAVNKTVAPKSDAKMVAMNKPAKTSTTNTVQQKTATKMAPVTAKAAPVAKSNMLAKSTPAAHIKKDGTPDKRFKENKKSS